MSKETTVRAGDRAYTKVGRNLVEVVVIDRIDSTWKVKSHTGRTFREGGRGRAIREGGDSGRAREEVRSRAEAVRASLAEGRPAEGSRPPQRGRRRA